ncbi:hypothetical protein [Amycolatopsis magusensis]|uniref:hypothetical protein n=1 Tax=Amycolatopsis magusensis TaxID=882444 RepID=UPI003C300D17
MPVDHGPLPLATVPQLSGDVPVAYAMAKIDSSGRFAEQGLLRTLGWSRGDALTITAEPGSVLIRRDPRGVFTLPLSGSLQIPAPLRARHGLRPGDRALLGAVARRSALLIYTTGHLCGLLTGHHTTLLGGEAP